MKLLSILLATMFLAGCVTGQCLQAPKSTEKVEKVVKCPAKSKCSNL